ncbi:hypothetical protein [Sulfitobacter sp. W074]|uniref:hypothetical protein n=1 Tax=Sulfitobacter sp. W074 TaxID=2867026 RepID=UPI0021A510A4|nr:hypothetical protein [Sulfitobacter sp. W074]UWR37667.1 hypothetical protein K3762_01070 [Sulfitobacter sp. W074]
MNRTVITRRIEALEGKSVAGLSAIVRLPKEWGEVQRAEALADFRASEGLSPATEVEVKECDKAAGLEVLFAGCMADVLDHVAKHGKRIGED